MDSIREFLQIFTEDPKATKASVVEVIGTFFILAAAFLAFIYLFA